MLQGLTPHVNKLKFLLDSHSPTILTGLGVGGTVATAVLTGRASFKAAEIIRKNEQLREIGDDNGSAVAGLPVKLSKTEKTKLVWKQYVPPVASGVLTIGCIVAANRISSKKIAALVVAGGISERALQEYKDKVVEKLGVKQDEKVRDEIAQDRVNANPPPSREVLIAGSGDVLCFDELTGRYFHSTVEEIKRAENSVNYELIHFMSCSLSHFYDEIGLPPTPYTDSVGWNMNHKMEVQFSTVMSPDQRPCVVISFSKPPILDYNKHWD